MSLSFRRTSPGSKTSRRLLGLPLVLLPLLLGGARPWFWSVVAGIFTVGLAWSLWSRRQILETANGSKKWLVGLGLLILYPLFQSLPLGSFLIDHLSPHLMLWKTIARDVALAPSRFFSISYAPLVSFFSALWWVFLASYALLLRKVLREETNLNWLYHTFFWIAGFEALYGLLQTLNPSLGVLWESAGQGVARGTFVNRNHYASFLGMVWPVLLAYLLNVRAASANSQSLSHLELEQQKKTRQKNWFLGFIIGLVLLGLFFSQSRGGIIGALISLTVFLAFGKKWRKKGLIGLLMGCWLVMFAYGSIIGFQEILTRFDIVEKDAPGRVEIWEDTGRMIQDHWLTGTGLGTYAEAIRVYQSHLTDKFDIVHAHNDYLELAGELGVPVAAAMVTLVWGYWWICARGVASRSVAGSKQKGVGSGRSVGDEEQAEMSRSAGMGQTETDDERVNGVASNRGRKRSRQTPGSDGRYEDGAVDVGQEQAEGRSLLALGALAGSAAFLCHSWVEFNWQIPANQLYFVVLLVLARV